MIVNTILLVTWVFLAISYVYASWDMLIREEFKKFYPHPYIGLYKSFKIDGVYSTWQLVLVSIIYSVMYLPITPFWFVGWCLYKLFK